MVISWHSLFSGHNPTSNSYFGFLQTQCQQELDQVLERISKMPFRDNRGPLEDLYALHIPNCDKMGQYNLKQVGLTPLCSPQSGSSVYLVGEGGWGGF